ncbi:hypothetical protein [Candidatus Carsonella ruddii]|uniref:Uncharacterized protein n=1 Tax=Candidatus Carsonella ruddii PC isolate NHV TaxID=1202540 RepID=J3TWH9_CARRU|nr:hypothetical protein [Candidatus Carsonella ruddii]AFP84290.1 hypothetical protein A357_075 [Candidatus Carsonella ruddii PC isolate NHV]
MIFNIKKFKIKKKYFNFKIKKICLFCYNYFFLKCINCFILNFLKVKYLFCNNCKINTNLLCNNNKKYNILIFIKKRIKLNDEFFFNYKEINSKILNKIVIKYIND